MEPCGIPQENRMERDKRQDRTIGGELFNGSRRMLKKYHLMNRVKGFRKIRVDNMHFLRTV